MSLLPAEERKLRRQQLESLRYIAFLLERLIWHGAPGAMEFTDFQRMLLKTYDKHIPDEVA